MTLWRTFTARFERRLPDWLSQGEGAAVWIVLSSLLDAHAQRALYGLRARFPSLAPADALSYIGADRRKIRGVGESRASYVRRLIGWLDRQSHPTRGGPFALLHEVRDYCGGEGIKVRLVDASGNWYTVDEDGGESYVLNTGNWAWDPIPPSPDWARQWLIIYPFSDGNGFKPWGRPAPLDGSWQLDGSHMFGTDAQPSEIAALRNIVKLWTGAGKRTEWIIYYFQNRDDVEEPDAFDPANPLPDATWYLWSLGPNAEERRRPPNGADATYIRGTNVTPYGAMIA